MFQHKFHHENICDKSDEVHHRLDIIHLNTKGAGSLEFVFMENESMKRMVFASIKKGFELRSIASHFLIMTSVLKLL